MVRPHKIPLSLSNDEFNRLKKLQTAFQSTTSRKVSMSDVLRRGLFEIPYQEVLL